MGSTARGVLLCYMQIRKHPAAVQVYCRSSAEPGSPISTAQSNALISRLRQDCYCSHSYSTAPAFRRDSEVFLASTHPVVYPLHVGLFSPRNALSACFSHAFQGLVLLTQQRVLKPEEGVLKWGLTSLVSSLWHLTHAPFFFLRSCTSHSQDDRRSWQRCDLITSWGSELLKLARAGCCLLPCFGWSHWVEEDQAEYLMICWFSH